MGEGILLGMIIGVVVSITTVALVAAYQSHMKRRDEARRYTGPARPADGRKVLDDMMGGGNDGAH